MQEDRNEIFDRQLRDLLDGAEVKAPRRVWRAVRSSLDSGSQAGQYGGLFSGLFSRLFSGPHRGQYRGRFVAFACTAAACIALGLFLFRNGDKSAPVNPASNWSDMTASLQPDGSESAPTHSESTPSNAESAPVYAESAQTRSGFAPTHSESAASRRTATGAGNGRYTIASEAKAENEVVNVDVDQETMPVCTSDEHLQADKNPEGREAQTAKDRKDNASSQQRLIDPFEEEDLAARIREERKTGRISLALNGTAGGNDSDLGSYIGRVMHYADGAESTERLGLTENSASSFGIPLSIGAGVRVQLSHHFYAGTGLTYTFLERRFTGEYNPGEGSAVIKGLVQHDMQYIGIPLDIYYEPFNLKSFRFYLFGGGAGELCVSNRYRMPGEALDLRTSVKGPIFSVNAGAGVEFKFNNTVGIYLDPSVKYYFKNNHPRSVRTDKPFSVNFDIGLRFNL